MLPVPEQGLEAVLLPVTLMLTPLQEPEGAGSVLPDLLQELKRNRSNMKLPAALMGAVLKFAIVVMVMGEKMSVTCVVFRDSIEATNKFHNCLYPSFQILRLSPAV